MNANPCNIFPRRHFQLPAAAFTVFALAAPTILQAAPTSANWPQPIHDNPVLAKVLLDRLELRDADQGTLGYWEGQAWLGTDLNRLWLKSEGSVLKGDVQDADLEAYYSRAVSAYWDAQLGMRHDFALNGAKSRDWLGFGFKGLAPYKFNIDATAYVGPEGRTAARLRAEYDLLITQRLIFWPEVELNFYGKEDRSRGLGTGLATADIALRFRYEIRREFAPYIGVQWTRKVGKTADFARAAGEPVEDAQFMLGVRVWW